MRAGNVLLFILLLCVAIGLQSSGRSQGNLVNLYNWAFQTNLLPGVLVSRPASETISSAESVLLYIGQQEDTNPLVPVFGPLNPILTGNISTIPGATYELVCTLQNMDSMYVADPTIIFGNFSTNFVLLPSDSDGITTSNTDFTVTATSMVTAMSFNPWCNDDTGGGRFSISGFSLVETPEVSTATLFGIGGSALLLAHRWRRSFQNVRYPITSSNASQRLHQPGANRHDGRT
jgi:hypothetical protein